MALISRKPDFAQEIPPEPFLVLGKVKKIFLFISAFFYLTAATGATLHIHYCMGEETSWSLLRDESKDCGKCGMEKKQAADSGCCKEESKQAKLEIDQSTLTMAWEFSLAPAEIIYASSPVIFELNARTFTKALIDPPPLKSTPVYLLDRNFRI